MNILPKYMEWDGVENSNNIVPFKPDDSQRLSITSTEREGGLSDDEIISIITKSKIADEVIKLYEGDISSYNNDQSAAELGLVNYLAFYTQDPEQINRFYCDSELSRDKWDEVHSSDGRTYGEMTIDKAIEGLTNTYSAIKVNTSVQDFKLINGNQVIKRSMKTDWLINNYIASDSTIMLFGAPASCKSLIALEMACCIGSGHSWHGESVNQGVVVYIAGEGFNGLSKRLNALIFDRGLSADKLHCSEIAMDLFKTESTKSVLKAVQNIKGLRLIIIDTLHRNFTGDENLSNNFAIALKHCDMLRIATGATIMLVHHSGHSSSDRSRGSSSMTGAMDAEFKVSKTNNLVTLHCTKMKDDEAPNDKGFGLESIIIGTDDSGEEITAPILRGLKISKDSKSVTPLSKADNIVYDILYMLSTETNDAISKADWKAACLTKISVKDGSKDPQGTKSKQFSRSMKKLLIMTKVIEEDGCFMITAPQAST